MFLPDAMCVLSLRLVQQLGVAYMCDQYDKSVAANGPCDLWEKHALLIGKLTMRLGSNADA